MNHYVVRSPIFPKVFRNEALKGKPRQITVSAGQTLALPKGGLFSLSYWNPTSILPPALDVETVYFRLSDDEINCLDFIREQKERVA